MANALIAFDNAVNSGVTFYGWTGGPTAPLPSALLTTNLSEKWVSATAATTSTRFEWAFAGGAAQPVALFALCNHNMTMAATVRITGSNDGWATLGYDSGAQPAFPSTANRYKLRWNYWHRPTVPSGCARWRMEITDTANPDGYVSAGRLFAAQSIWQPGINMDAGSSIGFEGGADVQTALNGGEYFTERQPFRVARFRLQAPTQEMLSVGMTLLAVAAGSQRELLFVYDPADTEHAVRRQIFGRLRELSPIEEPYYGRLRAAFEVKELL